VFPECISVSTFLLAGDKEECTQKRRQVDVIQRVIVPWLQDLRARELKFFVYELRNDNFRFGQSYCLCLAPIGSAAAMTDAPAQPGDWFPTSGALFEQHAV